MTTPWRVLCAGFCWSIGGASAEGIEITAPTLCEILVPPMPLTDVLVEDFCTALQQLASVLLRTWHFLCVLL
jgi:hypothetical protein